MAKIVVYTGPMFSGKTSSLTDRYQELKDKEPCVAIKCAIDKRYSANCISTHNGKKIEAILAKNLNDVWPRVAKVKNIFIDEGHFFPKDLVTFCQRAVKAGKNVYVATLDLNYKREPFEQVAKLMKLPETNVQFLTGQCDSDGCSNPSTTTFRLVDNKENDDNDILVGGYETYHPMCLQCHKLNFDTDVECGQAVDAIDSPKIKLGFRFPFMENATKGFY